MSHLRTILFSTAILFALTACGGGSNSSSPSAPASINGKTYVATIISGSGVFVSAGSFEVSFSTSTYDLISTGSVGDSNGSYIYSNGKISLTDAILSSVLCSLDFTSETSGTYSCSGPSNSEQSGTFVLKVVSYHPSILQGTWDYTAAYTDSSTANPSQWDWSGSFTLNADGSVDSGAVQGFWWSYSDMLIVVHPWQDNLNYGVDCSFLNLTSQSLATGLFEDKNLSGSGWWGRGTATMIKQ